jgi:hypothetical protein
MKRGHRLVFAQMAQEAQDQSCVQPPLGMGAAAGMRQAEDDVVHRHTARGVGLRVEEDLGAAHVLAGGLLQIGEAEVEEILLGQQHRCAGVVDVEKALQIGERIRRAQRLDARVGQLHAVALRQREDHLGFERALDVDVQLGLGHGAQERRQALARDAGEVDAHWTPKTLRVVPPRGSERFRNGRAALMGRSSLAVSLADFR